VNKESWPELRLFWLKNPNMSSLEVLASHLHEKTEGRGSRSAIQGQTSPIEYQMIERLGALEQQVYVLTDVVQAFLQIVAEDHERRSTRVGRTFGWIRETWKKFWLRIEQNMVYRIVAILGTIVGAVSIFWGLINHFHLFGR
jgi:hypothetical protein